MHCCCLSRQDGADLGMEEFNLISDDAGAGGSGDGTAGGENARAKLQATGRKMFNLDPRKGIKHLTDFGYVVGFVVEPVRDF